MKGLLYSACLLNRNRSGLVFVEAMAHKLPIVATKLGAIPDMVENGKNGFFDRTW